MTRRFGELTAGFPSERAGTSCAGAVVGPDALAVVARDVALGPPLGRPGVPVVGDLLAAGVGGGGVPGRGGAGGGGRGGAAARARAVVGPDALAVVAGDVALGPPLGGPGVAVVRHLLAAGVGGRGVPRRRGAAAGRGRRAGGGRRPGGRGRPGELGGVFGEVPGALRHAAARAGQLPVVVGR